MTFKIQQEQLSKSIIMKRYILLLSMAAVSSALLQSCNHDIAFDACGQIEATQVIVSAETNGKILDLNIQEGDQVSEGQMVGALDSMQVKLQVSELEKRMEGAKSRIVDINRQSAPNQKQLASLEKELTRFSNLYEANAATQKQVDEISDKIDILKAQIAAQKQSWERGNDGVIYEIDTYEVQLAQREDQLAKCRIVVPVSGTVLTKYAERGETVTNGKPLFKIADMEHLFVRAYFTTEQLAGVKVGDTVTVIPDDGSASPKEYQGSITSIASQAEFTPKNIQTRDERADMVYAVKVSVPNDGTLRLGMYAYIRK